MALRRADAGSYEASDLRLRMRPEPRLRSCCGLELGDGVQPAGHEVWALASSAHDQEILKTCEADDLAGIHWIFPKVRGWPLLPGREPKRERLYNALWQRSAVRHARELLASRRIDAIHHLTWAGIRAPTFLTGLGPPLIVGPIGGGESSPHGLRDEIGWRGAILERLRDISNRTIAINPLVRPGLLGASAIFVSTKDTERLLARTLRRKTTVFTQLALPTIPEIPPRPLRQGPPRFISAGRLLYWKGLHLALRAFAGVRDRHPGARFTIVGDGNCRAALERLAATLGVAEDVTFIPRLPQHQLFDLYDQHDFMLFPSLHDSGGFVALEALARGLPVACLDLGGPGELVTSSSGIVVATAGRSTKQVAHAMAQELCGVLASPESYRALSTGAARRAQSFVSARRINLFYEEAAAVIGHPLTAAGPLPG